MSECQSGIGTCSPPAPGKTSNEDLVRNEATTWSPPNKAFFVRKSDDGDGSDNNNDNDQDVSTKDVTTTPLSIDADTAAEATTSINAVTPERSVTTLKTNNNLRVDNEKESVSSEDLNGKETNETLGMILPKIAMAGGYIDNSNNSADVTRLFEEDVVVQERMGNNESNVDEGENEADQQQGQALFIRRSSVGLIDPKIGEIVRGNVTTELPSGDKIEHLAGAVSDDDDDDDDAPRFLTISRTQSFDEDEEDDYDVV